MHGYTLGCRACLKHCLISLNAYTAVYCISLQSGFGGYFVFCVGGHLHTGVLESDREYAHVARLPRFTAHWLPSFLTRIRSLILLLQISSTTATSKLRELRLVFIRSSPGWLGRHLDRSLAAWPALPTTSLCATTSDGNHTGISHEPHGAGPCLAG
jgi:hypothetical protein